MPRISKFPGSFPVDTSIRTIDKGGTGAGTKIDALNNLGLVPSISVGLPNGPIRLNNNGYIPDEVLPANIISNFNNLSGPTSAIISTQTTYTITDYDSFTNYQLSSGNGTVSRSAETITYTPSNTPGSDTIVVNGRVFNVLVTLPIAVTTPVVVSPQDLSTDVSTTTSFITRPFSVTGGTDTQLASTWELATDASFNNIVRESLDSYSDLTTWTVTGLARNTRYYLRVSHKGNVLGNSLWSTTISFTTTNVVINQPSIVSPANNATDLLAPINFTGSNFSTSNGSDTHEFSIWELSSDIAFNNIIRSSVADINDKTTWSVSGLSANTTYYARLRYIGIKSGNSDWSNTLTISTASITVSKPTIISPTNNTTVLTTTVAFTGSSFATIGGTDTHQSSTWQLATDSSFTNISTQSVNDTSNKTTWTVSNLVSGTTYYARVCYTGSVSGSSSFSDTVVIFENPLPAINTPSITFPSNLTTNVSIPITINSSGFTVANGTDTQLNSSWQLATDEAFTNIIQESLDDTIHLTTWPVTGLSYNTTYYARVKYTGVNLGSTPYSPAISFSTATISVNTPSITTPSNLSANQAVSINFASSAFSVSGGVDTQLNSSWQLATDAAFTNIIQQSLNDTAHLTSWLVTGLSYNTTYYARVKYTGNSAGSSSYSPTCIFVTDLSPVIAPPSITSPTGGYIDPDTSVTATTSSFTVTTIPIVPGASAAIVQPTITSPSIDTEGVTSSLTLNSSAFALTTGSTTHASSTWQISTSNTFSTVQFTTIADINNKTSWNATGLVAGTTYYARIKHIDSGSSFSEWSPIISFSTGAVITPAIVSPTINTVVNGATVAITTTPFNLINGGTTISPTGIVVPPIIVTPANNSSDPYSTTVSVTTEAFLTSDTANTSAVIITPIVSSPISITTTSVAVDTTAFGYY